MIEVNTKLDLIEHLGFDMSIKVFTYLDGPCDLVRASAVSRSWYRFVIENGLCKKLCFEMYPGISDVHSIEVDGTIELVTDTLCSYKNWECLMRNHKVYAVMLFDITLSMNEKTILPKDKTENRASYWLCEEQIGGAPETFNYEISFTTVRFLTTKFYLQPFEAYFEDGSPIDSSMCVRFRVGYQQYDTTGSLIWTYTSPHYEILQENWFQIFKLPEPALCIGNVVQVELVRHRQLENKRLLYYEGPPYLIVTGLPISLMFDVKIHHPSGKYTLKYTPSASSRNPSQLWSSTSSNAFDTLLLKLQHLIVTAPTLNAMLLMHCLAMAMTLILIMAMTKL